jgi:hypothetical protein
MQVNVSKNLLIKYCENECSNEEIALVESWYLALSRQNKDVEITMEDLEETKKMLDATLFSKLNTSSTNNKK